MPDPYRVLVTGSRTWRDRDLIEAELKQIATRTGWTVLTVIHGDCLTGADPLAAAWALRLGVKADPHPPDYNRHGGAAPHVRDKEMVDLRPDECLAFIERCVKPGCETKKRHGSHGATRTAELAEEAGMYTRRFTRLWLPEYRTEELF